MRRLLGFLGVLIIVLFGLSFAVLNADRVEVDYYFGVFGAPLSLVILVGVALGAVLGVIAALVALLSKQRELRRLRRQVRNRDQELSALRRLPFNESH